MMPQLINKSKLLHIIEKNKLKVASEQNNMTIHYIILFFILFIVLFLSIRYIDKKRKKEMDNNKE